MSGIDWADRTWIYHPTEQAKTVTFAEAKVLLGEGWFDTPDCKAPESADLSEFNREQLVRYAKEAHGEDIDKRMSKKNMLKAIEAFHDGTEHN